MFINLGGFCRVRRLPWTVAPMVCTSMSWMPSSWQGRFFYHTQCGGCRHPSCHLPPTTAFLSPLPLFIILIIAIATSTLVKNNPIIIVFSTLLFIVRPDVVKCLIIVCKPNVPRRLVCLLFRYDFFTVIRSKNKAMIRRYKNKQTDSFVNLLKRSIDTQEKISIFSSFLFKHNIMNTMRHAIVKQHNTIILILEFFME